MVTNLDKKQENNKNTVNGTDTSTDIGANITTKARSDGDLDFQPIDVIKSESKNLISDDLESFNKEEINNNEELINSLEQKIKDQKELINTLTETKDTLTITNNDLKSQILRIAADSQNASKQNEIDLTNAKKISKKQVIKNLLPFLTTIVLSFAFSPDNSETINFINQLKQALTKLNSDLDASNIQFIIPVIGDKFDPTTMQALNSSENDEPKVANIASVGCMIDNQVISPASVII